MERVADAQGLLIDVSLEGRSRHQGSRRHLATSVAAAAALVLLLGALWSAWRRESPPADAAPVAVGGEPGREALAADIADARIESTAEHVDPPQVDERLGSASGLPADPLDSAREKDAYRAFVEQESREQGSLDRCAQEVLAGESPAYVKVAFLRATFQMRTAHALAHFEWTVRSLPDDSTPDGVSPPAFAVRFLGARSPTDPDARALLGAIAFQGPEVGISLRRRAAADFARSASDEELGALAASLARESDQQLIDGAVSALHENPARGSGALIERFGRADATPGEEHE